MLLNRVTTIPLLLFTFLPYTLADDKSGSNQKDSDDNDNSNNDGGEDEEHTTVARTRSRPLGASRSRSHSHTRTIHPTHTHTGEPFVHSRPGYRPPEATQTPPLSSPQCTENCSRGQAPVAIAFEVIAGIIALVLAIAAVRCLYSYKRTPRRDRVALFISRHELHREMEERERMQATSFSRRDSFYRPPPPPYIPRPPSYDRGSNVSASSRAPSVVESNHRSGDLFRGTAVGMPNRHASSTSLISIVGEPPPARTYTV